MPPEIDVRGEPAAGPSASPSPGRSRLLPLAVAIVGPLVLLEIGLRVLGPRIPSVRPFLHSPRVDHPYDKIRSLDALFETTVLGFHPRERCNDFILNSKSFRTREYSEEKAPGTFRILAIGDSFTFSFSVPFEESWPERLRQSLQERTDARVEVINLGIPAVGPEFELRLWELEASKLHADLVVLCFPVGSNFGFVRETTWSEEVAVACCTYRFLRNIVHLWAWRAQGRTREEPTPVQTFPENTGGVPVKEVDPAFEFAYAWQAPVMSEAAFRDHECSYLRVCTGLGMEFPFRSTAKTLTEFRDAVEASGSRFVVMICPAELQTNPIFLRRALEGCPDLSRPEGDSVDAPQRFLESVFRREGIRSLDLLPAFREAPADRVFYGLRDSHWNPRGDALAAERLAAYLTTAPESGQTWPWQSLFR